MSGNIKKVRKGFSYLQCDDFAHYLSQMAAQGWHFKEWNTRLVFEKGEPEAAVYAVEVFIDGSDSDMRPGPHTLNFADYCEAAGWKLIDAKSKYCIFKRIREDAVPIVTPEERVKNAANAYRKNFRWEVFAAVFWAATLWMGFFPRDELIDTLFSGFDLMFSLWKVYFCVRAFGHFAWLYTWKRKALNSLHAGETHLLTGKSNNLLYWIDIILTLILMTGSSFALSDLIALIVSLLFAVLVALVSYLIAKLRPDNTTMLGVIFTFFFVIIFAVFIAIALTTPYSGNETKQDVLLPRLYQELYSETQEPEDTYYNSDTSVLGEYHRSHLTYKNADLSYDLYETTHNWLLDLVWEEELSQEQNLSNTSPLWNAEVALQTDSGEYLIRYSDTILILDLNNAIELTSEQVSIVRAELGLG